MNTEVQKTMGSFVIFTEIEGKKVGGRGTRGYAWDKEGIVLTRPLSTLRCGVERTYRDVEVKGPYWYPFSRPVSTKSRSPYPATALDGSGP